ncbi:MAG: shikimate dehydrogenase [Rhizobiaceae bacterium]
MAEEKRRAFVCGHPIIHSMSPAIHGFWISQHDLDATYEKIDVGPEDFRDFLENLAKAGFSGGNITIPHKEAAFRIVRSMDEAAQKIGAVNTVWLENGILCGTNTDWSGFAANLDEHASGWDTSEVAVVMGAGGAARGVIYALIDRGISNIRIVNRTRSRADRLAADFSSNPASKLQVVDWAEIQDAFRHANLLVNSTSLGLEGGDDAPDISTLPSSAIVTDIVYSPLETPLLKAAAGAGLKTVDGLGMLLHQAVPGFEKWFGVRPKVTAQLRKLIIEKMDAAS